MGRFLALGTLAVALAACADAPPASSEPATSVPTDGGPTEAPSASAAADLAWEVVEPAPFERIEMATVAHDDEVWLVGGLNADGSASDETWRFQPTSAEWSAGPRLDRPIHHAAAVSTDDDLYVIGGYEGNSFGVPRATVLVLNDAGDGWDEGAALPQPRAAGGAAWDGSRVVYAGGVGTGVVSDVLALTNGEWVQIGAMRAPREHLSATSDGAGRVWLMGGRALSLDTNTGAVELVEGNVVAPIGELATPRGGAAAFHLPNVGACLAGGEQPDRALDAVECVGADGALMTLPPLAVAVHGHGAAVVDGVAYIVLGGPQPLLTVSDTIQRLARRPAQVSQIPGELPPPDAPIPPRPPPLGAVTIDEVYAVATENGLPCESFHSDPEGRGLYTLGCSAVIDGVSYSVTASYWAVDFIDTLQATVLSAGEEPIDNGRALPMFEDLVRAVLDGETEVAAWAFVLEHFDDAPCGNDACRFSIPNGELVMVVGVNGARSLQFGPRRHEQ